LFSLLFNPDCGDQDKRWRIKDKRCGGGRREATDKAINK